MTDVYESVATTNQVEDKYARNETAKKAILGPVSIIVKCLGFDETLSLFKKETRGRFFSWIATPLSIIGFVFLCTNVSEKLHKIENVLTWKWAEMMLLTFLAVQSVAAACFLMSRTRSLFFLSYYDAWMECAKLAEVKEEKENGKENGDAENAGPSTPIPRSNGGRVLLVVLAYIFFISASLATTAKYAVHNGHFAKPQENSTGLLLDRILALEPVASLWAALITATALCVYGIIHGILMDTIDDYNKDLKAASDAGSLVSRLDQFAVRYQAVIFFARVLESKMGNFASFGTKTATVVNFCAMFMSLAFKEETGGLATLCYVLWTFIAIGAMVCLLLQPAKVQEKLNETSEILVADKPLWTGDLATTQQATIMLNMRKHTDTTVTFLKCLKLTPWIANGLMVVPPIIGGTLTAIKILS